MSFLSGIFGDAKTKPARLAREFDEFGELEFDPFMKGLMKNIRDRPTIDLNLLQVCEDHMYSTLVNNSTVPSAAVS